MKETRIITGLEIELEFNSQNLDFEIGEYHSPKWVSKYWGIEADSSVDETDHFEYYGRTAEFVSIPFLYSPENLDRILKDFQRIIGSDFWNAINFNPTCGNHIHLSLYDVDTSERVVRNVTYHDFIDNRYGIQLGDTPDCSDYDDGCECGDCMGTVEPRYFNIQGTPRNIPITFTAIKSIREKVLAILPQSAKENYHRYYAKKLVEYDADSNFESVHQLHSQRRSEINWIQPHWIEFRSFNLCGVDNWIDFFDLYENAFQILENELLLNPKREVKTFTVECKGIVQNSAEINYTIEPSACIPLYITRETC